MLALDTTCDNAAVKEGRNARRQKKQASAASRRARESSTDESDGSSPAPLLSPDAAVALIRLGDRGVGHVVGELVDRQTECIHSRELRADRVGHSQP